MKACGYQDRDGEMCKIRIHTLTSAYRNYLDVKRNTTGTAPPKKPPCFDELDIVLSDKPTTLPTFIRSSSGSIADDWNEESDLTSDVEDKTHSLTEDILNSTHIDMASSSLSPDTTLAPFEKQCNSSFYFSKSKKKKTNQENMFEKFKSSINAFMASQAENDKKFLEKFYENSSHKSNDQDNTIVVKVRNSGEPFFIEIELESSDLTILTFTKVLKEEFNLSEDTSLLITKLPNVLIRNDKDIKRLKTGQEIEFLVVTEE